MGCILGKRAAGEVLKPATIAEISSRSVEQLHSISLDVATDVSKAERTEETASIQLSGDPLMSLQLSRRRSKTPSKNLSSVTANWPSWLLAVAGDAIASLSPRRADTFQKLDKIGQGTYSNVYKARDLITGKTVALKKVRFDNSEPDSVKFMAREILVLRRLNHPNVIKLEGLATSRMSSSLYLVFEYMEHDLAGLAATPAIKFTEAQVKCYMKQLFSGLEHCHSQGVIHRDIKGSNLLVDNEGILKIADFGLASFFDPEHRKQMTSQVVTLWYRPPELLLGATHYGVGVDLWSAGCILAELLAGKPIMPGRTEVEQLHKIFKLCGSPPEEYWRKSKLPKSTIFKPQQLYECRIRQVFKDFPSSSLSLMETLLAVDPAQRGTATEALRTEFFTVEPYACEPSNLPHYPPSKEMDAKLRDEEAKIGAKNGKVNSKKRSRICDRGTRAVPAPSANAELQSNIDRRRMLRHQNQKSNSEKFPPPHQDGAVGFQREMLCNGLTNQPVNSDGSSIFAVSNPSANLSFGSSKAEGGPIRRANRGSEAQKVPARAVLSQGRPYSVLSVDLLGERKKGKMGRERTGAKF